MHLAAIAARLRDKKACAGADGLTAADFALLTEQQKSPATEHCGEPFPKVAPPASPVKP